MGIWAWVKRWLGIQPKDASGGVAMPASLRLPSVSAAELWQRVRALQKANAQWPEIWQALNPDNDPQVQRLLVQLRGPHMFAPHVALNVLDSGCQRALAQDANSDRIAALLAALQSGDPIVRSD